MCVCTSLLAFVQVPASAQSAPYETSGTIPGGGMYVMRRDEAAQTAAMQLWFRAPSAGEDAKYPGISRLAITALAASSAPHGSSLVELVNALGGTLNISVYPDIAMVGISVPSWDAPQMLRALTAAYFSPSISSDGMKTALRDCAVAAAETRFDAERMLQDALFAQLFTAGPAHYPATPGTTGDFTKIPDAAVRAFAQREFRRSNAVLSLAGAVNADMLSNVRGAVAGTSMNAPLDSPVASAPGSTTKTAYVAGLGYAWAGPPISDSKAATALDFVADYLFDNEHGTLARAIEKAHADAYVNGQFITLHNPGVLLLTISGINTPAVRKQIDDGIAAMQQPMDGKAFDAARAAFKYHLLSQMQTPISRAENFGWYAAEGDLEYAPGGASGRYLKAVDALDPAFVAQTVRTYLEHPAIVQLFPSDQKGTTTT